MTGYTPVKKEAEWNERKIQILGYLARYPNSTTSEIGKGLGLDMVLVSNLISNYRRKALVRRSKRRSEGKLRWVYALSHWGDERLKYLLERK